MKIQLKCVCFTGHITQFLSQKNSMEKKKRGGNKLKDYEPKAEDLD